ncbi:hypothetical protein D1872_313060 [compost metagenome]
MSSGLKPIITFFNPSFRSISLYCGGACILFPWTTKYTSLFKYSTSASRKFMGGFPRNPPTNNEAGLLYTSSGVPTWTIFPSLIRAIRSAMARASA